VPNLTPEQADAVYTILVEECGADDATYARDSFVRYMTDDSVVKEWRLIGDLGFGGKCRINSNHPLPYVDCYPEHETPERLAMIAKANERITALFTPAIAKEMNDAEGDGGEA